VSSPLDFETDFKFEIMTSKALVGKAPAHFNWSQFYRTFRCEWLTPRQLAEHVWRGYAFTPVWEQARREENFVSAGHMAFDFDAGDESSGLDALMRDGSFAWMFAAFAYSTPSSTPAAPRSRVVYVLEYPIHSAAEYREAYQAVAWWMLGDGAMTDPACKDPLRLYYGSPRCDVRPNWSVLGKATVDYVLTEYRAAHPPVPATRPATEPVEPTPERVNGKLAQLGHRVATAPQNEGHNTLLKMARLGGGYVASGALDEIAVVNELTRAAMSRPWADDEAEVLRVIRDGIANGKGAPVQFTAAPGLMGMFR
jgi:hypothetical protein